MVVIDIPKEINPVGNPIKFSLISTDYLEQIGIVASLSFSFDQTVQAGNSFELNLQLGEQLLFEFVDNPDNSGFQLQAWSTGMVALDWFNAVIGGLQSNYYLAKYYSISGAYNNYYITIQSRETGSEYTLGFFGATPSFIINIAAVLGKPELKKANFGIHARVIDVSTDQVLGSDRIGSNSATFDFSEYLKALVSSKIYYPEISGGYPLAHSEAIKEFYIEYWEHAQDYFSRVYKTDVFKAICGGVNQTHEYFLKKNVSTFLELFKSADMLLQTARPTKSHLSLHQPLHFYFINNLGSSKTFSIDIELTYTDGSNSEFDSGQALVVKAWEQGCLFLSPGIHELSELEPSKQIQKIRAQIACNTAEVSEVFEFYPIQSKYESILVAKNSFGTYEYLPFNGVSSTTDKYKREIFESFNKELSLLNVVENEEMVLNSAWMSKDERDWMRDILQSKDVYLIKGNKLESYIITTGESLRNKDDEHLYGLTLKLQKSLADSYYSKERNTPDETTNGFVIGTDDYIIGTDDYDIGID